jgi:hypothetical protein
MCFACMHCVPVLSRLQCRISELTEPTFMWTVADRVCCSIRSCLACSRSSGRKEYGFVGTSRSIYWVSTLSICLEIALKQLPLLPDTLRPMQNASRSGEQVPRACRCRDMCACGRWLVQPFDIQPNDSVLLQRCSCAPYIIMFGYTKSSACTQLHLPSPAASGGVAAVRRHRLRMSTANTASQGHACLRMDVHKTMCFNGRL